MSALAAGTAPPGEASGASSGAPSAATLDGPREVFGLIDLGARVIGISARHIREAVPMPQTVSPLPQDCPGLLGAMVLRGETIPLMSFAEALGIAHPESAPGGVVIVLRHEGRILGLVADGLRGMTSVALADCATLGTIGSDAAGDMLTFVHEGRVISTLDPQRVLSRPGIPFARDPQAGGWSAELPAAAEAARFDPDDFDPADFDPADFDPDDFEPDLEDAAEEEGAPDSAARLSGQGTAHMLCGYLGHCIAIPAHQIEATLPMSRIEASPLAHGPCRGVVRHHQREVPIVDTLQVLGLGASPAPVESSAGVILRFPDDGLLALELDRFYDISHFQESTLGRLPAAISERPGYFRGVHLAADGTAFLVTDVTALAQEGALQGLSQATLELPAAAERNRPGQAGGTGTGTGTGMSSMLGRAGTPRPAEGGIGAERLFLILDAAGRLACPIETILEIIRPPPELLAAEARFDGYIGKITHRQELVPIFCIARQRGDWPEFAPEVASILLLQGEDGMTGYLVEQLQSVEPARVLRETAEDPSATELIELSHTRQLLPVFRPEAGF